MAGGVSARASVELVKERGGAVVAKCGNTIVCREGYKTAMDFFPHLAEVKENLDQDIAGK